MPPAKRAKATFLLPAALAAVWLAATTLGFYLKISQLLIGFDGGYILNVAQRQFAWHVPLFSASMDWFEGLGDIFFGINFRLLPAFIAGSYFADTTAAKVAIYEVMLCEISISILLFSLSLGASRAISITAALGTCIVFLPFCEPTIIYSVVQIAPNVGSQIAGALLTGAAFIQFGRRNWLADLPYAMIVFVLLAWMVLVGITVVLLSGPFLLLCAVSGTIAAGSTAERWRKIGLIAAAGLFLVATGPAIYLVGVILDTAAVTFPAELADDRASFFFASMLFHWKSVGPVGPLLVICAIAGAVIAICDRSQRTLRIFAMTLLTYLGTRLAFAVFIIVFDFWRGPAALYFELFVVPLYAVFAAIFWAHLVEFLWRLWPLRLLRRWIVPNGTAIELWLFGLAAGTILLLALTTSRREYGFPYPPRPTAITSVLSQETGLQPGSTFRGRTADMIGRSVDRNVGWLDLHAMDGALADATGNELRLAGLHYFGIPGLFQYAPTISPFLYAAATRLLASPGDQQMRNVMVLRDIDPRILAMLGVRFVVTDRDYDGPARLRATVPVEGRTLLLYELANPNLGDYSPTTVQALPTAADIIARLADTNFDPAREIIADVAEDTRRLTPARNPRLSFLGTTLRIQAESDGRSILLIPLEFSHCLDATAVDSARPLLFRANLLETGILFAGKLDATLAIRAGPFLNPACRLRDLLEARALRLGAVPPRAAMNRGTGD